MLLRLAIVKNLGVKKAKYMKLKVKNHQSLSLTLKIIPGEIRNEKKG
jgi:hypothetical protein